MAEKKEQPKSKKKKRSAAQMHRQVQDSLQALPYVIEDQKKKGHGFKAFVLHYLSGPMLKLTNAVLNRRRYKGVEGEKQRQTDQMRRHLEQRQAAMKHLRQHMEQQQKRQRPR